MMMMLQGMSAFLERTNWVKACGGHNRPLLPGALLEVVVTAAPKQGKRMVHVSVDPKVKAKAVVKVSFCSYVSIAETHSLKGLVNQLCATVWKGCKTSLQLTSSGILSRMLMHA